MSEPVRVGFVREVDGLSWFVLSALVVSVIHMRGHAWASPGCSGSVVAVMAEPSDACACPMGQIPARCLAGP